ncbi:ABC transporter permease [Kocuria flava]|uniref:ABC transporter permease n=1 Tax=Kocuria flava TaxID=446860 RepID=A0A0U3HHB1_9MICC|nr:hypothetical protein [Kocuria flava]ALU40216.1 ABC transporter permease [Kocuria flava]GEO92315.1 hypothetical protein KFL01_16210 [Kocuria flava]
MGPETTAVLLTLLVVTALFVLIRRGWAGRLRRQAGLPAPPAPPAGLAERTPRLAVAGMYVSTTLQGAPLERVAAHGLGLRARAAVAVHDDGVLYARDGEAPLFVPAAAVLGTGTASGMAGKFVERDGLVVLTWSLGGTPVDTGFRTRRAADRRRLLAALEALAPGLPA